MTHPRTRTAGRIAVATVLSAGLLLTACGDDEDDATRADGATTEAPADDASAPDQDAGPDTDQGDDGAGGGVTDGVLTVELVDYGFEGLPESVPAGTRLEVENTSSVEFHEMVVFRLPDDEERTAEEILALSEAEQAEVFAGPPTAVLLAGPDGGEQTVAVGDGTLTEPGRYVLFCAIPTGADPEAYAAAAQNPDAGPPETHEHDGPPHFTQGMVADLVVE